VQCSAALQLTLHFVPAHRYVPPQLLAVWGTQVPLPLQSRGGLYVLVVAPSEQASGPHAVPATKFRHTPAPSHFPSSPQVVGSLAVQSPP
jgi:hypothetical protein